MTVERKDYPALTGIRFMAASMVFLFHYAEIIFPENNRNFSYYFFRQLNVGVNLFFVLSGFLIAHCYYAYLTSGQPLRVYFLKRVARIFPLYWAVLFCHFAFVAIQHHRLPDFSTVFLNMTLLHGLYADQAFSGLTQSWTLTVEETFYLYAPICFSLIRFRRFFLRQIPLLFGAGLLLIGVALLPAVKGFFGGIDFLLAGTFFGRCTEFFAGIYLALLIRRQSLKRKGILFTFGGFVLFSGLLLSLAAVAYHHQQPGYDSSPLSLLLFHVLLPVSIAGFYYGLLVEETKLKTFLSSRLLLLLGKSSYAFYLLHIGALAEVLYFHGFSNLFLLYLTLVVTSVVVYKFFEKPVYFFLLQRFKVGRDKRSNFPVLNYFSLQAKSKEKRSS